MNQPENTNPIDDDTEGHALRSGRADAEAAEGHDDTEGHATRGRAADAEATEGDDDTQGHRFYSSDRNIKDEVEPVTWEGDDDVEGHTGKN